MAKYVYRGKINGHNVIYKEGCLHGPLDYSEGGLRQNIMEVVTESRKKFKFRSWTDYIYILESLAEQRRYQPDSLNEVVIKEKGKKLSYNARDIDSNTLEGKRIKLVFEKSNQLYNEIRQEIFKKLKEEYSKKEPSLLKDKTLKNLLMPKNTEEQIVEEVNELFDIDPKIDSVCLYKDNAEKFTELFSKIEDKNKKKELLGIIFSCEYENKEVIDWLNKNEQDLLREAGFNS